MAWDQGGSADKAVDRIDSQKYMSRNEILYRVTLFPSPCFFFSFRADTSELDVIKHVVPRRDITAFVFFFGPQQAWGQKGVQYMTPVCSRFATDPSFGHRSDMMA